MTKSFFFMAALTATAQGRPLIQFNTITALPARNIGAKQLANIQEAGAKMLMGQVEFDDPVIQNVFFLGEMTEAEFMEGVSTADQLNDALAQQAPSGDEAPEVDAAANLSQEALAEAAEATQALNEDEQPAG